MAFYFRKTTLRYIFQILKRFLYILIFFINATSTHAQPEISNVTGNFHHNTTFQVNGFNFGTKIPVAPTLWDDCASNPPLLSHYDAFKPKNAQQGEYYNIAYRRSGFRDINTPNTRMNYMIGGAHAINRGLDGDEYGGNVCIGKNINSQTYFISYYYRIDPEFDDEINPTKGDNMKELVLSNTPGQFYPNGEKTFGYSSWCGETVPDKNHSSPIRLNRIPISPENQELPYSCSQDPYAVYHNNPMNGWIKMQWEGKYNHEHDSPQIGLTTYPDGSRTYQSHYGDGLTVLEYARGLWIGFPKEDDLNFIGIGGFARIPRDNNGINSFRYFAAVYMDNTHSRIMVGDNRDYDNCSIMEPQIPSEWSADSITATVNLGNLPEQCVGYIFVFNAENNHNPIGFPVSINENASDSTPVVTISKPTSQNTYAISNNIVDIGGSAFDDTGITNIVWNNNRGGTGVAYNGSGDWTSWSAKNISLQKGTNVITVTTTDTIGQSSTDIVIIEYNFSDFVQAWSATQQTGDLIWKESYSTNCVRLLINKEYVTDAGGTVRLGFQGRNTGDYTNLFYKRDS